MIARSAPTIVVGLDGSDASRDALRFAIREANLRGSSVRIITTCELPTAHATVAVAADGDLFRDDAEVVQNTQLTRVLNEIDDPARISRAVEYGPAGQRLVEAAGSAELLVVGTSHKGIVQRTVLGSVSEYCVRHSRCPTVVVVDTDHAGKQGRGPSTGPAS